MSKNKEIAIQGSLLIITIILMALLSSEQFLSTYNLSIMLHQIPEFGIIALAVMVVMLLGDINLSVIAMTKLAGIIGGLFMVSMQLHDSFLAIFGIIIMIIIGLTCGLLNGALVSFIGVPAIIATLAMMLLFEGVALYVTHGGAVSNFPREFLWIGNDSIAFIPVPLIIFVVFGWITWYILKKTHIGNLIYKVGEDKLAAKYSGIDVKRVIFLAYCYAGVLTGVAAIIMTSRYNSIRADYGTSYLLKSIVAVILGGVNVNGGKGSVIGVMISVCTLSVLSRGLDILELNPYLIDFLMGLILLVVLFVNYYLKRDKRVTGE
ncbi:ABC transporter permease [Vallitalea guaymasensis]|uniref:ABC transporter permease n=1 Tax=Vallitalea guaymasensis TaxID=1185412 RepID=UPI00235302E1|nr:ABC transporter permease [Vallitalea guaymasensis]